MALTDTRLAELERLAYEVINLGRAILEEIAKETGQEVLLPDIDAPSTPQPSPPQPREAPEPRQPTDDVGRFGRVTEMMVISRAQELTEEHGEWTRAQLATKVGLNPSQLQPFISKLTTDEVIEGHAGQYTCLVPATMRDWVVRQEDAFTPDQAAEATEKELDQALEELSNLANRGVVEWREDGKLKYVPPTDGPTSRPRHMPPERGRPSYDLAQATGMPVRVAATKRATRRQRSTAGAGGIKGAKQRDQRYNKMQEKKQERAEQSKSKAQQNPSFKSRSGRRSRPTS